jgi:aminopeptidase-like protein
MTKPDQKIMMELSERLWPLHRTLVCDDMDHTIEMIGEYLPPEYEYTIHEYPTGQKIWTWTVPEKYEVEEAYLEYFGPNGLERIVDFADNPLHIVSYGPAFEGDLSWNELRPHLHTIPDRPDSIPWVFKYYDRDWGFCLPHNQFLKLDQSGRYRVVMKTSFTDGTLKVGEFNSRILFTFSGGLLPSHIISLVFANISSGALKFSKNTTNVKPGRIAASTRLHFFSLSSLRSERSGKSYNFDGESNPKASIASFNSSAANSNSL